MSENIIRGIYFYEIFNRRLTYTLTLERLNIPILLYINKYN